MLNMSETVRGTDVVSMEYKQGLTYRFTLSDCEIFNDTKRRAICLRQLSFLFTFLSYSIICRVQLLILQF